MLLSLARSSTLIITAFTHADTVMENWGNAWVIAKYTCKTCCSCCIRYPTRGILVQLSASIVDLVSLASQILVLHHSYIGRSNNSQVRRGTSIKVLIRIRDSWRIVHQRIVLSLLFALNLASIWLLSLPTSWVDPLWVYKTSLRIRMRDPKSLEVCWLYCLA